MHAVVRRGLWLKSRQPARIISSRRYPQRALRSFHPTLSSSLDLFPWKGSPSEENRNDDQTSGSNTIHPEAIPPEVADSVAAGQVHGAEHSKDQNASYYGSGTRRSMRNKRPKEPKDIPPIRIPFEFMSNNVRRHKHDEPLTRGVLHITGNGSKQMGDVSKQASAAGPSKGPPEGGGERGAETSSTETPQYSLNQALMSEVLASMSAGLTLPGAEDSVSFNPHTFAKHKSHLKLLCPIDGGIYFLDKVVEEAAAKLGADVVTLDPQSIAEMAGDYIREPTDSTSNALWTLGYDTAHVFNQRMSRISPEDELGDEEGMEDEGERESTIPMSPRVHSTVIPFSQAPAQLQDAIKNWFSQNPMIGNAPRGSPRAAGRGIFQMSGQQSSTPEWNDMKLKSLLEALLGSNDHKSQLKEMEARETADEEHIMELPAASEAASAAQQDASTNTIQEPQKARITPESLQKTVVIVKDFKEMGNTTQGGKLIEQLINIVQRRRRSGQPILIVGTTSTADLAHSAMHVVENLQSEDSNSVFRTLVITPETDRGLYSREVGRRLREINGRHMYCMIKRLDHQTSGLEDAQGSRSFAENLHEALAKKGTDKALLLEDQAMSLDEVHRIVFTALGQRTLDADRQLKEPLQPEDIVAALDLIEQSDKAKTQWAQDEHQVQTPQEPSASPSKDTAAFDARIKKMRRTCNQHEKNLLRGVVNPDSINTAFTDVHAAVETIEALKMLTTLSLTRPEAFKYGVLAKDKINGLLLYGPPGTGKTLLAKAVAKESGATMLEVSGSDVYDMYVGEGEKNVRAVFSLAKKLAPCVVFIDEADAIFASRGSGTNRNSHRELINQFLREWDGMTETNAFIMVATNRPFDLDDAALRRLPRRLLVDLPSERDRQAILGIHVRDECLAADVSLSKLASQTPLYSGSDLKNLAVAAALAAVREENDDKARFDAEKADQNKAESSVPLRDEFASDAEFERALDAQIRREAQNIAEYVFPEKRTLKALHFDKAMEEISASVSEDMSSLGAIRKFDEKYGDRRGRRKKPSYGFSTGGSEETKEDSVKVRN